MTKNAKDIEGQKPNKDQIKKKMLQEIGDLEFTNRWLTARIENHEKNVKWNGIVTEMKIKMAEDAKREAENNQKQAEKLKVTPEKKGCKDCEAKVEKKPEGE